MRAAVVSARTLLAAARSVYAVDAATLTRLDTLERRLDEPLRVALVGSIKAGKSTLLNGLLGERIAPTDARECTRIVTHYHYGLTPAVRAHRRDGRSVLLAPRRQEDRLELDLHDVSADEFDHVEVTWPAPGIRGITLIDTPGTASISQQVSGETDRFLLPEHGAAGADAVIYLLRSLHESDVRYLQALRERTRHGQAAMGAIAVLSRADELGAGRLTAMVSINQAVDRLRRHPALEGVCETVVPVAGLMGMGAMTLRQADFTVLRALAGRPGDETRHLLVSAERFLATRDESLPPERVRADLVDRFGMYGIRIAVAVLRGGIADADQLAAELLRRSGLQELRRLLDFHFGQRQADLKAHSVVLAVHRLLRERPVAGSAELLIMADEHMAGAHAFAELQLAGRLAAGRLELSAELAGELERLVGGRGTEVEVRLGLSDRGASHDDLMESAVGHLRRWRERAADPLLDRRTHQACRVAERTCESIIATLLAAVPR